MQDHLRYGSCQGASPENRLSRQFVGVFIAKWTFTINLKSQLWTAMVRTLVNVKRNCNRNGLIQTLNRNPSLIQT